MDAEPPVDSPPELPPPRKAARPRTILVICLVGIVVAVGLGSLVPLLLPAWLTDGPMVQNATTDAASLVWYTSKPTVGQVALNIGQREIVWPSANEGTRHRVRFTGLSAGTTYPYRILIGQRELARGEFVTNKPAGAAFSFAVLGDSGIASAGQFAVAARIASAKPDFVLHTGDVVYPRGDRARYSERFFQPYREIIQRVCIWPVLGNHDVSMPSLGGDYLGVFDLPENGPAGALPERNYWFEYGNARFVAVDSDLDEAQLGSVVAPWLAAVLAAEPQPEWRFVFFHHPPYTGGKHKPDERVQRTLVPVFDAANVDMVFNGHDHLYERTAPMRGGHVVEPGPVRDAPVHDATDGKQPIAEQGRGVVYIISGAGGGELYDPLPPDQRPAYIKFASAERHSATLVRVDGRSLALRQLADDGTTIDEYSLAK